MLDAKLTETSTLHVNNNSFTGPLIIGTFEKQAPELIKWHDDLRFKLVSLLNLHVRKFITETKVSDK